MYSIEWLYQKTTTKKSNKNPSFYLKKPEKEKQIIPTGKKTMGKKKNKERKQKNNGEKSMKLKAGKYQQN